MSGGEFRIDLSAIDEERFGIRTARAANVTLDSLPEALEFCRSNGVVFLIVRCSVSEIDAVHAMEREGFELMDTLIYYVRDLTRPIPKRGNGEEVRPIRKSEETAVRALAAETFKGYNGHYHADERLDNEKCDEAYSSWASRSCLSSEVADEVLVVEQDGKLIGFGALRMNSPEECEGVLLGIASFAQRQGIYGSLITRALEMARSKGASRMLISTQLTNVAVQKAWARADFEMMEAYYTFHKWFYYK